jgi:tRNA (guanine37-N1)-methyltransferase
MVLEKSSFDYANDFQIDIIKKLLQMMRSKPMSKKVPYVCVEKKHGEEVRKALLENNLLNPAFRIISENGKLYFPLERNRETAKKLLAVCQYTLTFGTRGFEKLDTRPTSLANALRDHLSPQSLELVPRAYDLIGDIAVLEVPEELDSVKKQIGENFLKIHPNFETVLNKKGAISGTVRTREYELLAGVYKTDTIHTEYGCKIAVDLEKAYFSPRLLEEHHQVAQQVEDNELVIDLFCGVGPFPLHITKRTTAGVIAVDINPEAIQLLKRSIELNQLRGEIQAVVSDAHKFAQTSVPRIANRIIMNHPSGAEEFVSDACRLVKAGGVIHYYDFMAEPNPEEKMLTKVRNLIAANNRKVMKISRVRKVRDSAPYEYQMVADLKVQ